MRSLVATKITALCGIASIFFMVLVGRHQKSILLIVLFTIWVASPFAALVYLLESRWKRRRIALFLLFAVLVSAASASVYGAVAFGPPVYKPASFFLITPGVSWVLIGVFALALRTSVEKRNR